MKLGLITWDYRFAMGRKVCDYNGPAVMDLFGFVDRVAELGLDGFMVESEWIPDDEMGKKLREYAEKRGLYIELGSWGVEIPVLERNIRLAHLLGAEILRTALSGLRLVTWDPVILEKELAMKTENVRRIVPLLEKYRVKLAIENHQDATSDELVTLMKQIASPCVGICVDTGNGLPIMENPYDVIRKLAPYTIAAHFKDMKIIHTGTFPAGAQLIGTALGQGIFDLPRMLRIIQEHAPDINLTIEIQLAPKETAEESIKYEDASVRESVRYAREVLKI
jgi:sugar phosphate isomerase/epimerase